MSENICEKGGENAQPDPSWKIPSTTGQPRPESPSGQVMSFEEWLEVDGIYKTPEFVHDLFNTWFRLRDMKVAYEAGQRNSHRDKKGPI